MEIQGILSGTFRIFLQKYFSKVFFSLVLLARVHFAIALFAPFSTLSNLLDAMDGLGNWWKILDLDSNLEGDLVGREIYFHRVFRIENC